MRQESRSPSRGQCGDPRNIDPAVSPRNSPTIGIQGQITCHLLFHVYSHTRSNTRLSAFHGNRSYYILFNRKCVLGFVFDVYRSPFNPRIALTANCGKTRTSNRLTGESDTCRGTDRCTRFPEFRDFFVALYSPWTRHSVNSDKILLYLTIRVACLYSKNLISRIVFSSLLSGCSSG